MSKPLTNAQRIALLSEKVGTLSSPSKMPCYSYSTPATECQTGGRLRNVEGSTCSNCYACKGCYIFRSTREAMAYRFSTLSDLESWKRGMTDLIRLREKSGYFRWHDSGDIQSPEHLLAIFWIAKQLPDIRFWLPTREYRYVEMAINCEPCPANLTIRLSAHMVNGPAPVKLAKRLGVQTSTVGNDPNCPAYSNKGKCGDCRECWLKNGNIEYPLH